MRRPLRILVVEDDRDTALTLMMLLREEGHEVHAVYSGRYVMGAVIDVDPDVVLLDINLPDRSGWEVAQAIRQQRGKQRPRLIGISGEHTQGSDKTLAGILGFDHYLVKPYDPQALVALLGPLQPREPASEVTSRPARAETSRQAMLRRAAELMGADELAARLKVHRSLLDAWIGGHATMPDRKLAALADVLDKLAQGK